MSKAPAKLQTPTPTCEVPPILLARDNDRDLLAKASATPFLVRGTLQIARVERHYEVRVGTLCRDRMTLQEYRGC
jgi:hypothetical protein